VNAGLRALFFAIVMFTAFWNVMPSIFVGYDERFELNRLRQYLFYIRECLLCCPQHTLPWDRNRISVHTTITSCSGHNSLPHFVAQSVQVGSGAQDASYYFLGTGVTGRRREIGRGKTCQSVKFTTHLHPLLMLIMSEIVPSLPYMYLSNTY
jgi:hypothetical protein